MSYIPYTNRGYNQILIGEIFMSYYNFLSENTIHNRIMKFLKSFLKYGIIFAFSFIISFYLIYNSQYNAEDKEKEYKERITQLEQENKTLSETVDSLNIQIDNVKKFYEEEKKANASSQEKEPDEGQDDEGENPRDNQDVTQNSGDSAQ